MKSISVKRLSHNQEIPLPGYESTCAAGMDLPAAVESDIILQPGERIMVPTGLAIALPEGYETQIRSRSGLAIKFGVTVLNSPGTIDADYRGEIKVILQNFGSVEFVIERSMRIAQMVVVPVIQANLIETDILPETIRGDSGFGSTGIKDQKV